MRKSIILQLLTPFILVAAGTAELRGQACPNAAALTAGTAGPLAIIRYLADDALGGRLAGSPGERCAGDYIAQRFADLHLAPAGEQGSYFQTFDLASAVNPHAPKGTGRNVIALLEGSDPQLKHEYAIVGAHYDHLGLGFFGSTSKEHTPAIHNGADDNASGVAVMLEIAERLARGERPARSMLFIAFSGEESGLLGSAYFTGHPTMPLAGARAMINLDMVGRLGQGPLIVYGIGTAREWEKLVNAAAAAEHVDVTLQPDGYGASDHTSFYVKDIPVLHFFTNVHTDYHNPGDDWQKIDVPGLGKVAALVTTVATKAANKATVLTLQKGAGKPPAASGRGYGAYLGTIPDFTPVKFGVKISGVRANSPAEKAGLQAGDVIVRMDDRQIADLQAMTDALRAKQAGDAMRIVVQRAGQELVLHATLR